MFKQWVAYHIEGLAAQSETDRTQALDAGVFVPCPASAPWSAGWVPPRGAQGDTLMERVGAHAVLAFRIERRLLPGGVVRRELQRAAQAHEAETGRKPGRKRLKELKDEVTLTLLPRAFTQISQVWVWVAMQDGFVFVESVSPRVCDAVTSALVAQWPGVSLRPVNTALSPAAAMAHWLSSGEAPHGFTVDQECELKAADTSKATVRYVRQALDQDSVARHIEEQLQAGKTPTRLALTWQGRVSLTLTDTLQVRKVQFLEGVLPDKSQLSAGEDPFDANAHIATAECGALWQDLLGALGGLSGQEGVGLLRQINEPDF